MNKVRPLLLTALMAVATIPATRAEGYQINTLSATQNGMGHTGTALHLGSQSQIFNPAGLTTLKGNVEVTGSVTGIFATASATLPDGMKYTTDNSPSTPMSFTAGFSIYDNLKAGVAFYTPYGSGINWTESWPGAVLSQSVSLKTFTLQPTVAWQPVKGLSVGVGLMLTWGNVDLNKGLVSPGSFNKLQQALVALGAITPEQYVPYSPTTIPASINLTGKANVAVGVNLGVMYDFDDRWSAGFMYRSRVHMKVKDGLAALSYANAHSQAILDNQLGLLNQSNFASQMPCPEIYRFGVSYRPVKDLVVAFDAQLTGWGAYKALDIDFLDETLTSYDQHIEKHYHNSWTFGLGAEYGLTKRFDVRCGLMLDLTPVNADHYNPETPGMTKLSPSVGFSFRPIPALSIDAAFLYVAGLGASNRSCTYPDVLMTRLQGKPVTETFTADYHVHAFNPSIGLTVNF